MQDTEQQRQEHATQLLNAFVEWHGRQYAAPSPHYIKQTVLLRSATPDATWVETGTYMGDTTQLLAQHARRVYSIEPEPTLYENAVRRFAAMPQVQIIKGLSEEVFPALLPELQGDVNFWLDGHYSAGATFKGPKDTPITEELASIAAHLPRLGQVCVLVDDIRLFDSEDPAFADYPALDHLVDWARQNRLAWRIEHDIFMARTIATPGVAT